VTGEASVRICFAVRRERRPFCVAIPFRFQGKFREGRLFVNEYGRMQPPRRAANGRLTPLGGNVIPGRCTSIGTSDVQLHIGESSRFGSIQVGVADWKLISLNSGRPEFTPRQ